jgi:tetratricopeptide (TPR) repeat protein
MGDKTKLQNIIKNRDNNETNKNKYQTEVENSFGHKKIKKIIIHIVLLYFYRGICYENIGKIKNSIKCYYQCLWFIHHFFYDSYKNLSYLIQNILDKSLEFKEIIDYLLKKINYYKRIQMMNNTGSKSDSDKEEKNDKDIFINPLNFLIYFEFIKISLSFFSSLSESFLFPVLFIICFRL